MIIPFTNKKLNRVRNKILCLLLLQNDWKIVKRDSLQSLFFIEKYVRSNCLVVLIFENQYNFMTKKIQKNIGEKYYGKEKKH